MIGTAAPEPSRSQVTDARESEWGFQAGDEIASGLSAIKLLGGGFRYQAYLAWDDHLRALAVAKVVRPGLVDDRRTVNGLRDEVEMLDRLDHPVIVRSFGAELHGPRPHVVLEHLEGPRLSTLLRKYGPLPPEQLVPLGLQLCAAVHYMAGEGVVHLDVKPSNIIMAAPPRLIDLSVALTLKECDDLRSAVGTDAYMAPEQCLPREGPGVGSPADVWGVGVTLYRALTGGRPFGQGDPAAAEPRQRWPQLEAAPEPLDDSIPTALRVPIEACLAHNPADRPTAAEVGDALEGILETLPRPRISKLKPRLR